MSNVYEWHDPWAWVATKQRIDMQFPRPQVLASHRLGKTLAAADDLEIERCKALLKAHRERHYPNDGAGFVTDFKLQMLALGYEKVRAFPRGRRETIVRDILAKL